MALFNTKLVCVFFWNQSTGACLQKYFKTKTIYGSLFGTKFVFGSFSGSIFNTKLVFGGCFSYCISLWELFQCSISLRGLFFLLNQSTRPCVQKYFKSKTVYGSLFATKLVFVSFSGSIFNTKLVFGGGFSY